MAADMKVTVFWDVVPCSQKFSDISEVLDASMIRIVTALMMKAKYLCNMGKFLPDYNV
jgi:hypothetical protein